MISIFSNGRLKKKTKLKGIMMSHYGACFRLNLHPRIKRSKSKNISFIQKSRYKFDKKSINDKPPQQL